METVLERCTKNFIAHRLNHKALQPCVIPVEDACNIVADHYCHWVLHYLWHYAYLW